MPAESKSNPELRRLIHDLERRGKKGSPLWGVVARSLARPRHQVRPVNVSHLERIVQPDETVVVPTKLLASGRIQKKIHVAALAYSDGARRKILAAGGSLMSLPDLVEKNPDGKGVRIVG